MPPPKGKNHNPSGLGRAIINKKVKDARQAHESGLYTTDVDSTTRLQSITQERDLDEFLNTATLAGTQFTAERSHLVVQIVDARNPLRFRCEDLESYVQDVEGAEGEQGTGKGKRRSLLLINKADLLTAKQRRGWADYFDSVGVQYAFFSAANAAALQQARRDAEAAEEAEQEILDRAAELEEDNLHEAASSESSSDDEGSTSEEEDSSDESEHFMLPLSSEDDSEDARDPRAKVLSVLELEDLFVRVAPDLSNFTESAGQQATKLVIGLVGYPNVGKSSTINSLIGEKKVSVSSTPGKTKHFQTIQLSPTMVLCDCPGLVFPQFATTRADLVCDGVLPIDQLREHTGPTALVVKRIPKEVLEATYGLSIRNKAADEVARGFTRAGQGNPDEARAARFILKDYVNAKLLYCNPPPGISEDAFNEETWDLALKRAEGKKRAPVTRVGKGADTFVPANIQQSDSSVIKVTGHKSHTVDQDFFANDGTLAARPFTQGSARNGQEFTRSKLYPHQNAVADDGTPLNGRRARVAAVLANTGDVGTGKKHHKKIKRVKQRSGRGYD
ncbi:hypothetical protein EW026_g278 [Hermanssonia centrifuga]|uniref:G domain-containing protein n=1 Tax=Hermanssonia centrifuga TaxID=98765 RepID=A0A4S4KZK6_9APHY|nr:hypothetical protein EW026_g278 [Hermanssonia centrifuga]